MPYSCCLYGRQLHRANGRAYGLRSAHTERWLSLKLVLTTLDGLNALTQQFLGYPTFGYWKLFETAEAGKLLDGNASILSSLQKVSY